MDEVKKVTENLKRNLEIQQIKNIEDSLHFELSQLDERRETFDELDKKRVLDLETQLKEWKEKRKLLEDDLRK